MSVQGLREVEARLARALNEIQGASREAIQECTFDLLGKAVDLAPIETGDLKGSGSAHVFEDRDGTVNGIVAFGSVYARYQHEGLHFRHPQGGQARYLAQPFEENADRYIQKIKDSVRRET